MNINKFNLNKMYKKFNWGWGIAIVYSLFVLTFISILIYSTTQKVDLVNEDYYKSELNYQKRIEAINRTKIFDDKVKISFDDNAVFVQIPFVYDNIKKSKIKLYRPSNSKQDKEFDLSQYNLSQLFVLNDNSNPKVETQEQLSNFKVNNINIGKGFWKLQLEWEVDGDKYYKEESIMIN